MLDLSHITRIPPPSDWLHLGALFLGIFIFILISELVRQKLGWSQAATRKIVHIAVGLLMLFTPLLLQTSLPLLFIAAFFAVFNYAALKKNLLPGMHMDPQNLGTVYYPLSFFILVLLFWSHYKLVIIASVLVMAIGDAAAAIVGGAVSRPHLYRLIHDRKSREGSAAMFLVSLISVLVAFLAYRGDLPPAVRQPAVMLWLAAMVAVVATAAEALGHKGNDNLLVPLLSAVTLFYLITGTSANRIQFTLGMLLGGLVAAASYRARFLSASGAVTTFLLASVIFGFGGVPWLVPILTFFILSSLLSKAGKRKKERFNLVFEKGSQRDYAQVFANGGIAGLLMIWQVLFPSPQLYFLYLGALAAAMADTWATELGVLIGQNPRRITNFVPVVPGTSGGVSAGGFLGALAGAGILAASSLPFLPADISAGPGTIFLLVTFAGVAGSVVDSYLGATLQAQYRCDICGKITEKTIHCNGIATQTVSGLLWMNNDVVNFLNTLSGAALVALGIMML